MYEASRRNVTKAKVTFTCLHGLLGVQHNKLTYPTPPLSTTDAIPRLIRQSVDRWYSSSICSCLSIERVRDWFSADYNAIWEARPSVSQLLMPVDHSQLVTSLAVIVASDSSSALVFCINSLSKSLFTNKCWYSTTRQHRTKNKCETTE